MVFTGIAGWMYWTVSKHDALLARVTDDMQRIQIPLRHLYSDITHLHVDVFNVLGPAATGNGELAAVTGERFASALKEVRGRLQPIRDVSAKYPATTELFVLLDIHLEQYTDQIGAAFKRRAVDPDLVRESMIDLNRTYSSLIEIYFNLFDRYEFLIDASVANVANDATQRGNELLAAVTGAVMLLLIAGLASSRVLSSDFRSIVDTLIRLASGRRDTEIPLLDRKDEIGDIARATDVFKKSVLQLDREIAEHARTEAALRRAVEQATIADRSKSEFLANVCHELRTPLNAIIGFSDSIRHQIFGPLNGNQKYFEYLNDINESGVYLKQLIEDILDASAIDLNKLDLEESEVDVVATLIRCQRMLETRAQEMGVALVSNFSISTPTVLCDELRIKQIVLNLLNNALKFTEPGGEVSLRAYQSGTCELVIEVRDTGVGISPEKLRTVFDPFTKDAWTSVDRNHDGVGLGLYICKTLTKLHGGRLDIDSVVGQGTTVAVILPAWRVAGVNRPAAQ